MSRGAIGWLVFRALAWATGLAYWIAGPGEVERRIAALAWLERRPVDYPQLRERYTQDTEPVPWDRIERITRPRGRRPW